MRPSDWFLVELPSDPTPGDAFGVRGLAAKYASIAEIAGDASDGVHRARSSGAASAWIGEAGDIFREKSDRMPDELAKANDSYSVVAAALKTWADAVDDTQAQADRGLQQAREAHADFVSATAALDQAQASWSTVKAQQLTYQKLQKDYASVPPPANVRMPTDAQLRSAARNASQSQSSMAAAQHRIADADARLAAARTLVLDAKSRRDDAEHRVVTQIGHASDRAVQPSSTWEAIQDSAAWQVIVVIATVVLTILSIVFIIIGGPLVWALIIAATILLMLDCLMSIAQGKDAWGELTLLAVGLIPGGRILGLAAKGVEAVSRMGVAGEHLAAGVGAVTGAVSSGTNLVTHVVDLAGARIADAASEITGSTVKAIHFASTDAGTLTSIFQRFYHEVMDVNAANYAKEMRGVEGIAGFTENCTRCVIAADSVLAGVPRVAEPVFTEGGAPVAGVAAHFGKTMADFKYVPDFGSIAQTMSELGEGSRGIVYGMRTKLVDGFQEITSAHVFNVIHDANGVVFIDAQSGIFAKLENFGIIRLLITEGSGT